MLKAKIFHCINHLVSILSNEKSCCDWESKILCRMISRLIWMATLLIAPLWDLVVWLTNFLLYQFFLFFICFIWFYIFVSLFYFTISKWYKIYSWHSWCVKQQIWRRLIGDEGNEWLYRCDSDICVTIHSTVAEFLKRRVRRTTLLRD